MCCCCWCSVIHCAIRIYTTISKIKYRIYDDEQQTTTIPVHLMNEIIESTDCVGERDTFNKMLRLPFCVCVNGNVMSLNVVKGIFDLRNVAFYRRIRRWAWIYWFS